MQTVGIVAGSIAMTIIFVIGALFLIAPIKASEYLGNWVTAGSSPSSLRAMGVVYMIGAILFESWIVQSISK